MAQVRDWLNFPDRTAVPTPDAVVNFGVADGKFAGKAADGAALKFATIDGHVVYDGIGTEYAQRGKLIFSGDGISAIVDGETNDATEVIISGGGSSGGGVESHVSNCVLGMPAGAVTFSGANLTMETGVKALIPNGFHANGTWKSIEVTTAEEVSITESIGAAKSGILFLMEDGNLRVLNSELYVEGSEIPDPRGDVIWYNPTANVSTEYDAAGDELGQFFGVPIADFATDASGDVESLTQRAVVNVGNGASLRYWEL